MLKITINKDSATWANGSDEFVPEVNGEDVALDITASPSGWSGLDKYACLGGALVPVTDSVPIPDGLRAQCVPFDVSFVGFKDGVLYRQTNALTVGVRDGGGSGSGELVVKFETEDYATVTADHTPAEVEAAGAAGMAVRAVLIDRATTSYTMGSVTDDAASGAFQFVQIDNESGMFMSILIARHDDDSYDISPALFQLAPAEQGGGLNEC